MKKQIMIVGNKKFLRDSEAISPVIATLILLVIAAVAAAGVGLLTQKAQDNANSQTTDKNLDVIGTVKIKGGTNSLEAANILAPTFQKKYPAVTLEASGGGTYRGFIDLINDKVDIAGEWGPYNPSDFGNPTIDGVKLPSRKESIIQEGGADAKYWETPIAHDVIAIVSNLKDNAGHQVTLNIVSDDYGHNDAANKTDNNINLNSAILTANNKGDYILNITYSHLRGIYNGTQSQIGTKTVKTVQYTYYSYAEQEFARFLRLNDEAWSKGIWGLKTNGSGLVIPIGQKDHKAVRDYISNTENSIGFLPIGFATGGTASGGATNVLSAYIEWNKISPSDTSALDHKHDTDRYFASANKPSGTDARTDYPSACLGAVIARKDGLAGGSNNAYSAESDSDLHACLNEKLYAITKGQPTGAAKAYIDYATSPAGQKELGAAGILPLLS